MPDTKLVLAAIRCTDPAKQSARAFSKRIGVNERTVRRWLAGDAEIRDPKLRQRIERMAKP